MGTVRLDALVLDFSLYPRTEISSTNVARLREAILFGEPVPPITAWEGQKRVVDGFHRVRAYQSLDRDEVEVEWRTYASEAEAFEDAVRLNGGHGLPLQRYDLRRAVARLTDLGYSIEKVSAVTRIAPADIGAILKALATDSGGKGIVIKRGLAHLEGRRLNRRLQRANEGFAGFPGAFYVRQVRLYLETGPPLPPSFVAEMGALLDVWQRVRKAST